MNIDILDKPTVESYSSIVNESLRRKRNLLGLIANHYGVTVDEIKNGGRGKQLIKSKRLYCYIAYELMSLDAHSCGYTLTNIANDLGLKQHGVIINHIQNFKDMCSTDPSYFDDVMKFAHAKNQGWHRDLKAMLKNEKLKYTEVRNRKYIASTNREFIKFR